MNKILQVIREKEMGHSARKVARLNRISPSTVCRYWRIYKKRGYVLADLEKLTNGELNALFNPPHKQPQRIIRPDYAYIHRILQRRDETLTRQWNIYREEHSNGPSSPGRTLGLSQFCANYRRWAVKIDLAMRQPHKAGEVVFVDFCGRTVPWTDAATGKQHYAQVFVAVMGCSGYLLFRAAPSQKLPFWIELHNWLYQTLGGIPCVTTPDNLKSAVIKAGREFVLNPTYADQANHYSTVIIPARVGKPKDKAPVENGVKLVRRWVLAAIADMAFFSIDEINQVFDRFMAAVNDRPFKRLPGCRRSWFEELDKPALKPLPIQPYEFAEWTVPQKVPKDYHVRVLKHLYSVPYSLVGEHVTAKVTATAVEIRQGGKVVANHVRSDVIGMSTTLDEHLAPEHRFYAEQTPDYFLTWAQELGPSALAVVRHQFDTKPHPALGLRACASLKTLARDFGTDRFEAACHRAGVIGAMNVKSIRLILQGGLDKQTDADVPEIVPPLIHGNVRGPEYYAQR